MQIFSPRLLFCDALPLARHELARHERCFPIAYHSPFFPLGHNDALLSEKVKHESILDAKTMPSHVKIILADPSSCHPMTIACLVNPLLGQTPLVPPPSRPQVK